MNWREYVENGPKAKCELCGKEYPDMTLMHLTRDKESPICCCKCYFAETEKFSKWFFRKVKDET